jgi:hypothetical protein
MLTIPSTIHSVRTLADKSVRLTIDTQEVSPEQATELFSLYDKFGWLAFKEVPITKAELDLPEPTPEFKGEKSQGQRIRACCYRLWEQKYKSIYKEFPDFYKIQTERIIEFLKSKLT